MAILKIPYGDYSCAISFFDFYKIHVPAKCFNGKDFKGKYLTVEYRNLQQVS